MRRAAAAIALLIGLALALPAAVQAGIRIQFGSGGGAHMAPQDGSPHATPRPERRGAHRLIRRDGGDDRRDARRHHRRGGGFRHSIPLFRYYRDDRDDRIERDVPPPVAPPPEPPPEAAAPPPPPDPRGPLRLSPARGAAPGSARWSLGEALPPGLPHVTLDWRQFDLPEPPAGRVYARVGRDVLLITAEERVVEAIVPPS